MRILVANLGSTSYKYRLFDMAGDQPAMLAKGGYDRVTDFGEVIEDCLKTLIDEGHLGSLRELTAVGFKTVLGKNLSGCQIADQRVLDALDGFAPIAPAHNPAYAAGIRQFAEKAPDAIRVALFETAFFQWVPDYARRYAVPKAWFEAGVQRYSFHGASHKFIAERSAELLGRDDVADIAKNLYVDGPKEPAGAPVRVVSCHLGGSSSIAGIRNGAAIGSSMGLSPQSGLPQNNRVGDLDSNALPFIMRTLNLSLDEAERQMNKEGGLLGLSGVSNDLRDIKQAAAKKNGDAALALNTFVHYNRQYIGSFTLQLNGVDAICFTGGIGENNPDLRADILRDLHYLGLEIDPDINAATRGEGCISTASSKVKVFVIPANEELVVARETKRLVERQ